MNRPREIRSSSSRCCALLFCWWVGASLAAVVLGDEPAEPVAEPLRAVLIAPETATKSQLEQAQSLGMNAVVLPLTFTDTGRARPPDLLKQAAVRIGDAKLAVYYWIEIGRCPELADAHPEWMASLQGHPEWRRLFRNPPVPGRSEVVKNYPWVPILYKESFAAHLERVQTLLRDLPPPQGIFLNDLQGAPSACGCGNTLCRWTADYGDIKTATPLEPDAAAQFVQQLEQLIPGVEMIPVWTTECEEPDCDEDGHCAGVGCFEGICWKAYTSQLMPVAERCQRLGALLLYKSLQRDLSRYGPRGSWIPVGLETFRTMPPKRGGKAISADRLIAVLQGWDVPLSETEFQQQLALQAGAGGFVLATVKIDQSWQPRIHKITEQK